MLGKAGCYAELCKTEGYIGVDFLNEEDLTNKMSDMIAKAAEAATAAAVPSPAACPTASTSAPAKNTPSV